jgi:type III secretion protein O
MGYPLQGLLSIREFREEAARKAVLTAELALRAALEAEKHCQRELEAYRIWRREEMERRYQAIMGREMSLKDMDDFKAGLAALADKELALEETARQAAQEVEAARLRLKETRAARLDADRARLKIVYHRDQWLAEQLKVQERAEDLELEEFQPRATR